MDCKAAGQGDQDSPARVWTIQELLDAVKTLDKEDLQCLKIKVVELAEAAWRAPPPELAQWGLELYPADPQHLYQKCFWLFVKCERYEVKAGAGSWSVTSGKIMETSCYRFSIGALLYIETHTNEDLARLHDTCVGFEKLQEEFKMDEVQSAILLGWLYEVIGKDLYMWPICLVTEDNFPAYKKMFD